MEARRSSCSPTPVRRPRRLGGLSTVDVTADGALPPAAAEAVLAWGNARRRDLPWRHTRDAWAVLVSEVMLQQTSVGRVAPRWSEFLHHFPDPASCAAAGLGEVLRVWSGLGYPRRARDLHATARAIVERHAGTVPADLDALLALPGIGPYTARAVQCFAFELDAAVVDVNIGRVLCRAAGRPLRGRALQAAADASVLRGHAWAWNQSLMDVGATVCRARQPRCDECPLRRWCRWASETDDTDPAASTASRQAPFAGSDREARGRLMRAAAVGPIPCDQVAAAAGLGDDVARADVVASGLVADGLLVRDGSTVRLP